MKWSVLPKFFVNHRLTILIIPLLIFSFIFKIWQLETNPLGFFCDEAFAGVEARSILLNGKDTKGNRFPIIFTGFSNSTFGPFLIYPIIPFIPIFGMREITVRLPGVIISVVELMVFYTLLSLFITNYYALAGTFLLSISPWHFHTSRNAMGDLFIWSFLTTISLYFLSKALLTYKTRYFCFLGITLGLTLYSYPPSQLTTLIFFALTIILLPFLKTGKKVLGTILCFSILLIPYLSSYLTNPYLNNRIKETVINPKEFKENKKEFMNKIGKKYLLHYKDNFLFKIGDYGYPVSRHSITGLALLYPYQKWLIILGLIWSLFQIIYKKKLALIFVILLFLLFPISDSLTKDSTPFATRSYLGVVPLNLLTAFGIYFVAYLLNKIKLWKYYLIRAVFILTLEFFIIYSLTTLITKFQKYPSVSWDFWGWQYGPKEIISYFKAVENDYDELIMEPKFNGPDVFFPFYAADACKNCFVNNLQKYDPKKKQLFALSKEYFDTKPKFEYETKNIIYSPNGDIAFKIVEVREISTDPSKYN